MTIISWTLANEHSRDLDGAVASAARIADECLIIWTGDPESDTRPVSPETTLRVRDWAWTGSFADARNTGLQMAADLDAEWSMMIDSDESIICPDPLAFRALLRSLPPEIVVVLVHAADGTHTRERAFRGSMPHRFIGRTHEMLPAREDEQVIAPREMISWVEIAKTREQLRVKFLRDEAMLLEDIRENPKNGSAHFYLGATRQTLACYTREDGDEAFAVYRFQEAIEAFREHRRIDTESGRAWHEGTAWSCFKAAECYLAINEPDRALDCAAAGLVLDAGIAELYWIGAIANLQQGRMEQARCWARAAKAHGMGSEAERRRRGFRNVRGLTTGPDEVLRIVEAAR